MNNLTKHPLFTGVPLSEIQSITKNFHTQSYRSGQIIINQGDKASQGYLLLQGKVEVFYKSRKGLKTTIILHNAPNIFGVLEFHDERPRLAYVSAIEKSTLLIFSKKQYFEMLQKNHQIAINQIKILAKLMYQVGEDRRVKFFGHVEHLLANLLRSYADLYGEERDDGIYIRKELSKTELADALGVARQSVIRAFNALLEQGLICVDRKNIIIPDIIALKKSLKDS